MSDCCTVNRESEQHPRKYVCPKNGKQYLEVPFGTVLHHIRKPWELALKDQAYYFCDDPHCDVVYFGVDGSTISKDLLRTKVGIKETDMDALICYCFGVSKAQANKQVKTFVMEQTKHSTCSCSTSNPSGRCCLKDFPK